MKRRITTATLTLHVVEEFDDADETPSLPGMRVYTTDGEEVTQARPLAKCGPVRDERKKAGGGK